MDPTAEAAEEGANIDLDATRGGKSAVIKTSTRQTIFLPIIGLVDADKLKPAFLFERPASYGTLNLLAFSRDGHRRGFVLFLGYGPAA